MRRCTFLLLLTLIRINTIAQVVNIQWEQSYGGSSADGANSIRQTPDSGYIVAGSTASTDLEVSGNHGGYDFWILKLTPRDSIVWAKCYGGSQDDYPYTIQQTTGEGYMAAGATESDSGTISGFDGEVTGFIGAEYDYWFLKLSDTGSIEWATCYGGTNYSQAHCTQQTTDSGYISVGDSYCDNVEVTAHFGDTSFPDYWLIKVNDTGALMWEESLGGSGSDYGRGVLQTTDGGYIVAGHSNSTDGDVTGNHGDFDYWIAKLNDTGGIQWEQSLGGSGTDLMIYSNHPIQQTFDGGYIVAGSSNSTDGQVTGNHGGYDFWVVKLNDSGAIQWENSYGGSSDEYAYCVQQTSDSGYVVCGSSNSTDGQVTGNHGGVDYWIIKLSKNGVLQWETSLGGSGDESAYSIAQTLDSGFIVAGSSNSTDSEVTGNHGSTDFWVVKLSSCQLSSNPVIVTSGDTLSTLIPYSSYQWLLDGNPISGATNATYTYSTGGAYSVFATDSNTCSGASLPDTLFNNGINTIYNSSPITIMPNPTTGAIWISGAGIEKIEVYNMIGQLIKTANNTRMISIADFPAGMYFIKLFDNGDRILYQDKIIKQ